MMFPAETETDQAIRTMVDGIDHYIYRSFFNFDLSVIPSDATIISCTLTLENYGAGRCNTSLQEGTQTGDPDGGDYSAFTGLSFGVISWSGGSNNFPLAGGGASYIQSRFGLTAKLCMREYDHDYLDVEPDEGEDIYAGLYWSGAADPDNKPKLIIEYAE